VAYISTQFFIGSGMDVLFADRRWEDLVWIATGAASAFSVLLGVFLCTVGMLRKDGRPAMYYAGCVLLMLGAVLGVACIIFYFQAALDWVVLADRRGAEPRWSVAY
jgi:VIT1/CCC1 family predicted Fe2+/Mn2+ transporter